MGDRQVLTLRVRVNLGVRAMKLYSPLPRASELDFSVIPKTPKFFKGWEDLTPSAEDTAYSKLYQQSRFCTERQNFILSHVVKSAQNHDFCVCVLP